mmetsp:Transcript_1810/g.4099  ORF Transcript_1810/g.4099 Transcript_1810/m.4099 type:complete len:353 (+) Transcript_1810:324-1382(+)
MVPGLFKKLASAAGGNNNNNGNNWIPDAIEFSMDDDDEMVGIGRSSNMINNSRGNPNMPGMQGRMQGRPPPQRPPPQGAGGGRPPNNSNFNNNNNNTNPFEDPNPFVTQGGNSTRSNGRNNNYNNGNPNKNDSVSKPPTNPFMDEDGSDGVMGQSTPAGVLRTPGSMGSMPGVGGGGVAELEQIMQSYDAKLANIDFGDDDDDESEGSNESFLTGVDEGDEESGSEMVGRGMNGRDRNSRSGGKGSNNNGDNGKNKQSKLKKLFGRSNENFDGSNPRNDRRGVGNQNNNFSFPAASSAAAPQTSKPNPFDDGDSFEGEYFEDHPDNDSYISGEQDVEEEFYNDHPQQQQQQQ